MINDLKLTSIPTDKAVFVPRTTECSGVLGVLVDDTIGCGDDNFAKAAEETGNRFDTKDIVLPTFEFAGITVEKTEYRYLAHQASYAKSLQELSPDSTFDEYRTLRHKLAWFSLTRHDICATANIASQTTEVGFDKGHVKAMNKVVRKILGTPHRGLRYHNLDKSSLILVAISDASFGNNEDLTSQLGHILILRDNTGRGNILSYTSYKSKIVVRSVLGAET